MIYSCECCDYKSSTVGNVERHMKALHPEYRIEPQTCSCNRVFSSVASLQKHQISCDGISPLQCPTCKQEFANKSAKFRHSKGACEFVDLSTHISNKNTNVVANNSTVTGNNNVTNNTIINVSGGGEQLRQVLDFASSQNTKEIIMHIHLNPSDIQAAHKLGDKTLIQALTSIGHYKGPEVTRNITKIDPKSSKANVIVNGKYIPEGLQDCMDVIEKRNTEIVNTPEIKQYLTVDPNKQILVPPIHDSTWKRNRRAQRDVCLNGGAFSSKLHEFLPSSHPPPKYDDAVLVDMALGAMNILSVESLSADDVREALHPTFTLACNQLTFVNNIWWESVPTGTGWVELIKDPVREVETILHKLKIECIDHLHYLRDIEPPGDYYMHLRAMCDSIGKFNIKPSASELYQIIKNPPLLEVIEST